MLLRTGLMIFIASRFMNTLGGVDEGGTVTTEEILRRHDAANSRDYTDLDELVALHTEALQCLNAHDWPIGYEQEILVGYRYEKAHWYSRAIRVPVYHLTHAVSAFPRILITRSGAIYVTTYKGSPDGQVEEDVSILIDLDQSNDQFWPREFSLIHLRNAFEEIIGRWPIPGA